MSLGKAIFGEVVEYFLVRGSCEIGKNLKQHFVMATGFFRVIQKKKYIYINKDVVD